MKNQIIIHAAGKQTRIALLENNELAQLFIESPENQRTVGDIYVAEVRKVMGGIRAAFIDMNTPKDAFLHYSDLGEHLDDYLVMLNGQDSVPQDAVKRLREYRDKKDDSQNTKNGTNAEEQNLLGNLLKPGHKVLVQIVKEPIGSKGPRVSTNISIAGRFLVLIPMGDYVAVSKRIRSYKERRQLRQTVSDILPEGFGVIVRTVAEGVDQKLIEQDLNDVLEKWNNIVKNLQGAKPPTLLHRDLDMTESLVRDLFAKDFDRILVDDSKMHKTLKHYVSKIAPNMLPNIELYKGRNHIFDHMNIMQDVESVFSPRVKMPSGGYLIFEQTEAMYVVDVNSGRYAAKKAQEDNSLKTNLESAREIAKQLRLRDIGGIIVVDFIDLRDDVNRKKVYDELKKEFRKDRAKTNVLPMSDFGLVQITRQRIRPSVVKSVSRVCPMCGGGGSIVSQNTILSDIESWLSKFRSSTTFRSVDLHINPYMRGMLTKGWISQHFKWMLKYRLRIGIIEDLTLSMNDYKFTLAGSDIDITETILHEQSIESAIKAAEKSIAELESEHKRDSTTLDIYKKEKSKSDQTQGRRSDNSNRSERRSDVDNQRGGRRRDNEQTADDERSNRRVQLDVPSNRQVGKSPMPKVQEKQQEDPLKETAATTESKQQSDSRRNQKISKYYKKENDEQTNNESPRERASNKEHVVQTPKSQDQVKPVSDASNAEIPEELAHLRSAWEVAKEYKIKRDKELQSQNDTAKSTNPESEEKSEEAGPVSKSETIEDVAQTASTREHSEDVAQTALVSDDATNVQEVRTGSKKDHSEQGPDDSTMQNVEDQATTKPVKTKKAPKKSVEAASSIVQALVASSKLKEEKESDDKKTDESTEGGTSGSTESPDKADITSQKDVDAADKKAAPKAKKKPAPRKKAKTAEEVAKKTASKRKPAAKKENKKENKSEAEDVTKSDENTQEEN
ncbi:MAG: Rne/Rng family ribonuclease [Bacteroidetes bacterium]|nr:Rne/Rng family ribonuclease [Bacteroidota bacterium]